MRRIFLTLAACLLIAGLAAAQTPTPVPSPIPSTTLLVWDHDGVNTTGYALVVDETRTDLKLTPVCGSDVPRSCTTPFPALTPGNHTLIVIAYNLAGEAASPPFPVVVMVKPANPGNIRIK